MLVNLGSRSDFIMTVFPLGVSLRECQMLHSFLISPIFLLIFKSVILYL